MTSAQSASNVFSENTETTILLCWMNFQSVTCRKRSLSSRTKLRTRLANWAACERKYRISKRTMTRNSTTCSRNSKKSRVCSSMVTLNKRPLETSRMASRGKSQLWSRWLWFCSNLISWRKKWSIWSKTSPSGTSTLSSSSGRNLIKFKRTSSSKSESYASWVAGLPTTMKSTWLISSMSFSITPSSSRKATHHTSSCTTLSGEANRSISLTLKRWCPTKLRWAIHSTFLNSVEQWSLTKVGFSASAEDIRTTCAVIGWWNSLSSAEN